MLSLVKMVVQHNHNNKSDRSFIGGAAAIVMDALCSSIIAIFNLPLGLTTFIEFDSITTSVYAQQSNSIYFLKIGS